jgi:GDP-4-dehydro-6-deoxy-D-mannose reductase
MSHVLVTGGGGFVGQWLTKALLQRGTGVVAAGLGVPPRKSPALSPSERKSVEWVELDVRRGDEIDRLLARVRPDVVYHLAGVSYIPDAQDAPAQAYDVNVLGAVRLLSAVARGRRAREFDPRVLVVGSGMQYGRHGPKDMPLTETATQAPLTVYAATKAAQEVAALQAFRADGVRVVCTRSFNHSGPGHPAQFLLPALVRRAFALRESKQRELAIGNGESIRDYLHVHDVVSAYMLLAERGEPGEVYNVCSGEGVTARQLASDVLMRLGITADISTDPTLVRSADVNTLIGSPSKLQALGWRRTRSRDDIIDDLIHAETL